MYIQVYVIVIITRETLRKVKAGMDNQQDSLRKELVALKAPIVR
jgi:hypothetical protein